MSHNREKETYPNKRRVVDQGRSMSNNISGRGPSSNSNNNPMQHGRGGYNRNQNQHQHQHHQQRNPNPHYNNRYDNNNNNFFSNRNNNSNNHGRNSNDRQSHPWETRNNRSNDPTPFTAQIEQQASLNDPIPRRSFNNNNINSSTTMTANNDGDNDTTMIQVDDDRHRATADPNRIPMELTQDWNLYSKEEQYRLLLPSEKPFQFPLYNVPPDLSERRKNAVSQTLELLKNELFPEPLQEQCLEESDSGGENSDDDEFEYDIHKELRKMNSPYQQAIRNRDAIIRRYSTFIEALPYCTPLDLGFLSINTFLDADKFCWCPCQKQYRFWRWRNHCNIDDTVPFICTSTGKFAPHPLLKHLEIKMKKGRGNLIGERDDEEESSILHRLVYEYLQFCYQNFTLVKSKNKWYSHKAFHDPMAATYKEIEAAQNDQLHRRIHALTTQLEQANVHHERELQHISNLEATHRLKAEKLKAELEQKHKLCQRLEIEITDMRKKFEINHNELVKYDDMRKEYFHFCQWKVTQQYKKKNKKLPKQRIVINGLHHEFKVADTIQDWIDSGSELVTDLDETNRYKWLARMQVNFQSLPPEIASVKEKRKDKAVDEGGPSRYFFSRVWRQLRGLKIRRKDTKSGEEYCAELFNEDCVPNENVNIISQLHAKDIIPEVENQVRKMCRMIGRLIFYVIGMSDRESTALDDDSMIPIKFMLGSHVLPNVYRYYYLQNKDPTNPSYALNDLVHDVLSIKNKRFFELTEESRVKDMEMYNISADDESTETDLRARFRETAKKDLIDSRSWAVESIRDGLSLEGAISLPTLFAGIPMEYINTMLFATQQATAAEVIEVLSVSYDPKGILDSQKQILRKDDLGKWTGCLPDLLRRAEAAFVSDFVEFVTGSPFVPYMKTGYKITIEFNQTELESTGSLVVAHTCPNVLKIPGSAYDGNGETLESKIRESIEHSKFSVFNIQ